MACVHGNDPRTCIVCKTLAEVDTLTGQGSGRQQARGTAPVDLVSRGGHSQGVERAHHFGFHIAVFAAILVAAAISVWFVAGVIFSAIRLIEVLLVAVAAGTLGYRVGRARGRRERR